ncbi:Beta-porphyranase B [Pontiella sulfatireligans]|uniref:Beta-porphyranase B n=2 Tax=Pontiella sulfatireligans TaxID=2750658 RepID=A0A6C2UR96_9BACT|nr:Beta-porphyranase B [Pontiella sulfatireligans]
MNKITTLSLFVFAAAAGACAMGARISVPPPPVEAPEGYKWVLNTDYSDEFDGKKLNRKKWHDTYPGWEGRVPGKFVPSSVSVKDGFLEIKCTVLDPPQGVSNEWWVACGAIQSKAQDARYGYYETRMKASGLTTSSTFWLMNPRDKAEAAGKRTELDIQECIGNAKRWPGFKHQFRANTHVTFLNAAKVDGERPVVKKDASFDIGENVDQNFHRYGCWWVDANTMKFYLDGKLVQTIEPPTDLDKAPFDQPMFVNLVCEIYDWETLPTKEGLLDDSRNTTRYDYVRSYKLVKTTEAK